MIKFDMAVEEMRFTKYVVIKLGVSVQHFIGSNKAWYLEFGSMNVLIFLIIGTSLCNGRVGCIRCGRLVISFRSRARPNSYLAKSSIH